MDFQVTKLPLLISTIMLAGCIGKENSTVPVSLRNLDKVKQKQVMNYLNEHNIKLSANSDGMNDNDIAANIPRVDAVDEPSNLYTYIDNSSKYDISLVGCDASDYMENHLESQILSNSYAPRTTNYNQKWKQYDDGNGILDPDHKTDNYIHFNNTPTGDNIVKCYYKVDVSETGIDHPMYFAIKHHFYTYTTFFKNIGDTAQAQAVHYAYQTNTDLRKASLAYGPAGLITSLVPWRLYQTSYQTSADGVTFLDFSLDEAARIRASSINRKFAYILNKCPIGATTLAVCNINTPLERYRIMGEIERLREDLAINGSLRTDQVLERLLAPNYGNNNSASITNFDVFHDRMNNKYYRTITLNDGSIISLEDAAPNVMADLTNLTGRSPGTINKIWVSDDASGFADRAFGKAMERRLTPEATRDLTRIIPSEKRYLFGQNIVNGELDTALIERTTVNRLTKETASKAGLYITRGLAYIGTPLDIALFIAPWIIDIWSHDAPWGNYATTQVFDSLDAVSISEATSWNQNHSIEQQIVANTKLTPPDPTDPIKQGNSPLMHMATLSYNTDVEKGVDSQIALNISLAALTTPNKRLDYVNPQKAKDDPWLGNIDFDASPRPQATWDAVLHLSISNSEISPNQEIQYQGQLLQMEQMGLTTLAQDERINAPVINKLQLLNTKNNAILFDSSINHSDKNLLKVADDGLLHGKYIDGLFLNTDQQIIMNVALPKQNSNSNALYGSGFDVNYIGEDESGTNNSFTLIKSDSLKDIFDSESNASSYLYSRFTGVYPLPLGQSSPLQLSIGGYNDNKRHMGHLYIGDAGSKIKTIPVYVNAHLIREPSETQIDPQGITASSVFTIKVQNMGSNDYTKVIITGLPTDLQPLPNPSGAKTCSNNLVSGGYCELTFDGRTLNAGSYQLIISGINNATKKFSDDPNDADTQPFTLDVSGGF